MQIASNTTLSQETTQFILTHKQIDRKHILETTADCAAPSHLEGNEGDSAALSIACKDVQPVVSQKIPESKGQDVPCVQSVVLNA